MSNKPKVIITTAGGHIASFQAGFIRLCELLGKDYEIVASVGGVSGLENRIFEPINTSHLDPNEAGPPYGADRNPGDIGKISSNWPDGDILLMEGGDNHLKVAARLAEMGIKVIGYPKTMDGDTGALITCGWETAVTNYSKAIRFHHKSAVAYKRVFFVGEFGRDRDAVLIPSTAWGGADRGIPCEGGVLSWKEHVLPRIKESYEKNGDRYRIQGVRFPFAVVAFSEGAKIDEIPDPPDYLQSKDKHGEVKLQPEWLGLNLVYLMKQAGIPAAMQVYTYTGRDYPPTQTDALLSEMASEEIAAMIREGDFGRCAVFIPKDEFFTTSRAPLREVAEKISFRDRGFFDYIELVPNIDRLVDTYGNLFNISLGSIPNKDDLVYRTMHQS